MKLLRWLLWPFSVLYGWLTAARNGLYDAGVFKSTGFNLPVISVGNLSAGGTGKTPHIEYLIRLLSSDYKVATLSRGYGRKTSGFVLVKEQSTVREVGDEPLQFKRKFPQIVVAVCENRLVGINRLLRFDNPPEVVLLDDAFQHRRVKPGCSVLLTTFSQPWFKDFMLPTGNLREWRKGAARADLVIVTKCPLELTDEQRATYIKGIRPSKRQQVLFSSYRYGELQQVYGKTAELSVADLAADVGVVLVTGIANSLPLAEYLQSKSAIFKHLPFPDHHHYKAADLQRVRKIFDNIAGRQKVVITTEKDAMRLASGPGLELLSDLPVYYLPVEVYFHGNDQHTFNEQIRAYAAGANERNGSVS